MSDGDFVFERLQERVGQALPVLRVVLTVASASLDDAGEKARDAAVLTRLAWNLQHADHPRDQPLLVDPLEEAALHLRVLHVVQHRQHEVDDDGQREVLRHGVKKVLLRLDELENVKTNGLVQKPVLFHLLDDERAEGFADEGGEQRVERRLLIEEAEKLVHDVGILHQALLQRRHIAGDDLAGNVRVQKALRLVVVRRRLRRNERNQFVDDFSSIQAESGEVKCNRWLREWRADGLTT